MISFLPEVEPEKMFDKERTVIISTPPDDRRYGLRYNNDGTFSIMALNQIGLTTLKVIGHGLAILQIQPLIKFSVPLGLRLQIVEPMSPSYYDRVNVEYDVYEAVESNGEEPEELENRIPEAKIIVNPKITIYADVNRYRQNKKAAAISTDEPLVDIYFQYIATPEWSHPVEIEQFVVASDKEFYNDFIKRA